MIPRKRNLALAVLAAALLAYPPRSHAADAGEKAYTLRPGDHIEILVPHIHRRESYPDSIKNIKFFAGETFTIESLMVTPGGKISVPMLGEITVAGLNLEQLQKLLSERLSEHTVTDEVYVILREIAHPHKVYVLGDVRRAGGYEYHEDLTLLKVIALAGGFTDFANPKKVKIYRSATRSVDVVNLKRTLKGDNIDRFYVLQPEDVIVVPRTFF